MERSSWWVRRHLRCCRFTKAPKRYVIADLPFFPHTPHYPNDLSIIFHRIENQLTSKCHENIIFIKKMFTLYKSIYRVYENLTCFYWIRKIKKYVRNFWSVDKKKTKELILKLITWKIQHWYTRSKFYLS